MELGVEDKFYSRHYFATETEPIRKKIYETKIAPPNERPHFENITTGVSRMQKGFYAFHMGLRTGYKAVERIFQEHEKCGLVEIKYLQNSFAMHVTPKNSPYKEIFKVRLVSTWFGVGMTDLIQLFLHSFSLFKLHERGIQSLIFSQRGKRRPTCNSHAPRFESVRLVDCYAVALVFCYGIAASLILLFVEIILKKWKVIKKSFRSIGRRLELMT